MKTTFEKFCDLEGQVYDKTNIIKQLSEIYNQKYDCLEENVKNEPDNEENTEYHSIFTASETNSIVTINYDKLTNRIVAPLIKI